MAQLSHGNVVSGRSLSEALDIYARAATVVLGGIAVAYSFDRAIACGRDIYCNDIMQLTGIVTCLVGVVLSFGLRPRFRRLFRELIDTGAIEMRTANGDFEAAVTRIVGRYCLTIMLVLTAVEIIAYKLANHTGSGREWTECLLAAAAASVVGERFGRLAAYTRAGNLITRSGGRLSINFWHPDNAGGLLPLSRFYCYTALLAAIPAMWLGVWWVIIPRVAHAVPDQLDYSEWRLPLLLLWLVVVSVGLWSAVMPIYRVHRVMERAKEDFMVPLNWIPQALSELHAQLRPVVQDDAAEAILKRIDGLEKLYRNASAVITWPLNPSLASALTGLSAAQLLIPIGLRLMLGEDPAYQEAINKLLERLSH